MSKNFRRWMIVAVSWLALVGILGFIKFSQISAAIAFGTSFPEPSETVLTALATETQYRPTTQIIGEVVPTRSVMLRNELAGAIVEVGFRPGSLVAKGQLLIGQDVSEEIALLGAANARDALAQQTLDRNESLIGGSAISRQAVDDALAQRDAARAEAQRIEAVIQKKQMRAPFAGRTGLERWEPGGYLSAGTEITALVGQGDQVWIDFFLPQQSARLAINSPVTVMMQGIKPLQATVIARTPAVDRQTRTIGFRAELVSPKLAEVPGAIVTVSVPIESATAALVIPALSVRQDTFGPHVFTLVDSEAGADGPYRAARRAVRVFGVKGEHAFIAEGLTPGELVAAQGAFKLRDGILVNLGDRAATKSAQP